MRAAKTPDPVRSVIAHRLEYGAKAGSVAATEMRDVPVEVPIAIVYNSVPYAVMMAAPADLDDFAYGFSLTEGVIASMGDIRSVEQSAEGEAIRLDIALSGDRFSAHLARKRAMSGRTGCGVCGVTDLANLPHAPLRARKAWTFEPEAIAAALGALERAQPLNARTHAMHAAAFADRKGSIALVREDVGRHNALDKLIGRILLDGLDADQGFGLITSRCSFEMVEKAAAAGLRLLVAISAPTSLAIERAQAHGIMLIAVARSDYGLAFTGPELRPESSFQRDE
ncbi:MAG TPA: formate dehydrogenase accessory sulfurtransferase FdhD [Beijerinckiaceae bacterium]|nr:formate dehydrogenase accessory sulfurtransferase FdhD [Beijerinckiaceae bacterium]